MLGFQQNRELTLRSVHFYIAYMISGYFIELHITNRISQQDSIDLYDWDKAFKTYRGVVEAFEKFRFSEQYAVYKLMRCWNAIDTVCMYSHLVINMMIVLWCIGYSVSLYFAINLTIIVVFYLWCISEVMKIDRNNSASKTENPKFDLQTASDLCRKYKKDVCDAYLMVRMKLWRT